MQAVTDLDMVISIPMRVEDRRQSSWLVNVPDVDTEEIARLVQAFPNTRFISSTAPVTSEPHLGEKTAAYQQTSSLILRCSRGSAERDDAPDREPWRGSRGVRHRHTLFTTPGRH